MPSGQGRWQGFLGVTAVRWGSACPHSGAAGEVSSKHGRVAAHPITVPFQGPLWPLGSPVLLRVRPALWWWWGCQRWLGSCSPSWSVFGAHTSGRVPALWVYSWRPGGSYWGRGPLSPNLSPVPASAAGTSADWPVSSCHQTLTDPDLPGQREPMATFCPPGSGAAQPAAESSTGGSVIWVSPQTLLVLPLTQV